LISTGTGRQNPKPVQIEQQRQSRLDSLLSRALEQLIVNHNIAAVSKLLLDGMLLLTGSAYGLLGEVLHDPDGVPYLKTHVISDIAWDEASRRLYNETRTSGMEFRNSDTLFGAVLSTGKTVIANDPASDPRRSRHSPEGHPQLKAFLGIPVFHGETLIGMAGLANSPEGYDEASVDSLHTLTLIYASILNEVRQKDIQQQLIDSLGQARDAAELANRAKSEYLASWGHELRTPLHAILGHAQILQMDGALAVGTRQQIDEIAKGARLFNQLIGELLERIDSDNFSASPPEPIKPTPTITSGKTGRHRILVAEDHPTNQMLLRMQLTALGFDADIAADSAAAMLKWQKGGHDLILTDHHLPGLDGLELARAIRAAERDSGAYTPIIAITTEHYPEELAICREAGMDAVLPKPIELDALRCMLEYWLHKAATRPAIAILDTANLINLIGDLGAHQVREIVGLFITTVHTDISACHQHLDENNSHALALTMHKLKSSARIVGALRFASLAERIEATVKNGCLDTARILFIELEDVLENVEIAAREITASEVSGIGDVALLPEAVAKIKEASVAAILGPDDYVVPKTPARPAGLDISPDDILAGIRHAEFKVHFQPKVDARTLCVVGVETLARWQRNGKSPSPNEFFATATEHGLVGSLSEVLLTKALISGIQFAEAGYPLTLAINLSINWLTDTHFPQFILASIQAFGFKAENLILEITDLGMISDMTVVLSVMTRLRLKGFKLSVTDFGTGHPLATLLPRIPVNELKFDRRFVRDATQNPSIRATMSATLGMAKTLKLTTVAEGIETQADLDWVCDLGCDFVQGWFIAKDMPEDELLEWLKGRSN